MNALIAKQKYEARLSLSLRYMIPILLILTMALGFAQYGVSDHKNSLDQKAIFQEVETKVLDVYASYRHYASYGFRIMFLPAPLSILFTNSTVLQDMTASIFPGHRLHITQSMKGRNTFKIYKYLFADFSGILFFFGSLIGLLYGYTAFPNIEYQRFLASITGGVTLFFSTLLARAIMLIFFIMLFIAAAILLIALNGVSIGIDQPLLAFFMEICGVSIFFLALGSVFGAFKLQIMGFIGAVSSWFSFLFIVPFLVSIIVAAKSDVIKPEYKLEIEKLKLFMDFEKRSNEIAGVLGIKQNPTDIDRELVLSYYKNEFQAIQKLEEESKTQMQELTNLYYKLSSCFPTTWYLALTNEVSSKGYKTLYVFYESAKQIKEAFFKEYMAKVYFSSQPAKVEPFLKGDENIFKGKPALPDYLLQGMILNLLWISVLTVFSYYRFKKKLFELPEKKKNAPGVVEIKIKSTEINSWQTNDDLLNKQLYNFLSNKPGEFQKKEYSLNVTIDEQKMNISNQKRDLLYLCHPSDIPGYVKTGTFLTFIMDLMGVDKSDRKDIAACFELDSIRSTPLNRLESDRLGMVFLAILEMKRFPIYLFGNSGRKMKLEFCYGLAEKMKTLNKDGSIILFTFENIDTICDDSSNSGNFKKSSLWIDHVVGMKDIDEKLH